MISFKAVLIPIAAMVHAALKYKASRTCRYYRTPETPKGQLLAPKKTISKQNAEQKWKTCAFDANFLRLCEKICAFDVKTSPLNFAF